MSLYNMIFGRNAMSPVLLGTLDLTPETVGRFRDAYLAAGDSGPEIAIYTRNGGGNREAYEDVITALQSHPMYLRDRDDDFDCTYTTFFFRVPEKFTAAIAAMQVADATPAQRWEDFLSRLATSPDDPAVQRVTGLVSTVLKVALEKP